MDVIKKIVNTFIQGILAIVTAMGVKSDVMGVLSNFFNNALE